MWDFPLHFLKERRLDFVLLCSSQFFRGREVIFFIPLDFFEELRLDLLASFFLLIFLIKERRLDFLFFVPLDF